MQRNYFLIISLSIAAVLTGYLLSAISLVGRAGINLMYTEYKFLKSWWKSALLVFVVWMILLLVQSAASRARKVSGNVIQIIALVVAVVGLLFSYLDFRNSISHRWLGERFHLGVYLFWIGWIVISIFQLLKPRESAESSANHRENIK